MDSSFSFPRSSRPDHRTHLGWSNLPWRSPCPGRSSRPGLPWRMATIALLLAHPLAGQSTSEDASRAPVEDVARTRLESMVEALNLGNADALRAFVREAVAPGFRQAVGENDLVATLHRLHARSGRLEIQGVGTSQTEARGALRNRLTDEVDSLFLVVEEASPHRIVGFGPRPGAGGPIQPETAPFSDEEIAGRVREFVDRLAGADAFSGVVLLAREGRPLLFEAWGPADRNFEVPNRMDTRFNVGSMNKTFTAAVIGQLVEEGLLHWDDPLSRFLPDFPDPAAAKRIRIYHLLSHTAGLGSYFNARYREGSRLQWRTVDDYMELARPDSLRFEPGTRYAYSNTGFLVLGKVIEVVTGQPWDAVIEERIHRRAGMTGSGTFDVDLVVPNLAVSYTRTATDDGPTWRNTLYEHVIRGGPAGGGFATAEDLLRYAEALRGGAIVSPETLELMRTPKNDGATTRYGYGMVLWPGPGHPRYWGHGGDFEGVDADLMLFGDSGYTLIVLANQDSVNPPIIRLVQRLLATRGIP